MNIITLMESSQITLQKFNGKIVNGFCLCVDILSVQSNKIKPYLPVLYKASEAIFWELVLSLNGRYQLQKIEKYISLGKFDQQIFKSVKVVQIDKLNCLLSDISHIFRVTDCINTHFIFSFST